MPRPLRLAEVRSDEKGFRVTAGPDDFPVRESETVELVVVFAWEEASAEREETRLTLDIHLDDGRAFRLERDLEDRPAVRDKELGVLAQPLRAPVVGDLAGRYAVRLVRRSRGWIGGTEGEERFEHAGRFRLTVV